MYIYIAQRCNGAEIQRRNQNIVRPLYPHTPIGRARSLRPLRQMAADAQLTRNEGRLRTSVLHLAAYGGMSRLCNAAINTISVSKLVITDSDGKTALHIAVARGPCMDLELDGKASVCRKMIDNGGVELLMAKMLNGRTALHLAAERGMSGLCVFMVHKCVCPPPPPPPVCVPCHAASVDLPAGMPLDTSETEAMPNGVS